MSNLGCLFGALSWFTKLSVKYGKISQDAERKANTSYFGIYSIVISIVIGALFVLLIWGIVACVNALDNSGLGVILIYVLIAILAVCELVLFAQLIFGGLMGILYQFRCNRKPIGWIALAVFIVAIVGMAVGIYFIFGNAL